MSIRALMTMRATIVRNIRASADPYGQAGPPEWSLIAEGVPCRLWHGSGRLDMAEARTIEASRPIIVFPSGTDIQAGDQIEQVTDRLGIEIAGKLLVEAVARRIDHLECVTRCARAGLER